MPSIQTIQPEQVEEARRVIYATAHEIFHETPSVEESIALYSQQWPLHDMDDGCRSYFEKDGTFLVMVDDDPSASNPRVIGMGAIRRMDEAACELKRLWFLPEYHGRGLGYQMITTLMQIARERGYRLMRLSTSPVEQAHAVAFYRRLGFYDIPRYHKDDEGDIALECVLDQVPARRELGG